MGDLSEDFWASEFSCPCCGQSKMDPEFVGRLQALRSEWDRPIRPVDGGGYRCEIFDRKAGAHTQGRAIDPALAREDIHPFLALAFEHGFQGIGVKNKDGRWQVHIDDAESEDGRPRPWVWTY